MKLLLADPDRDFLKSYGTLLTLSDHTVTTVFDGTQVMMKLLSQSFDMVILNEWMHRIPTRELIRESRSKGIPVIVLSKQRLHSEMLTAEPLASDYLPLPFLPKDLLEAIDLVRRQRQSTEILRFEDVSIEAGDFTLCGTLPITAGETAIFYVLLQHESISDKRAETYITALNYKLEKLQKNVRIRYLMNDGYRLVKMNYE